MGSIDRYKRGFFFSPEFIGDNSWNGYEHNLLFECVDEGEFADVARPLGCDAIEDSRGVAVADLNDDGRLDLVVSNNNARPAIYLNQVRTSGNWLRMKLVAAAGSNRNAIGTRAQVKVRCNGESRSITRWVEAGTGYAAQSDMRLHFGLGDAEQIESLTLTWPDGSQQRFGAEQLGSTVNASVRIEQGRDDVVRLAPAPASDVVQNAGGG